MAGKKPRSPAQQAATERARLAATAKRQAEGTEAQRLGGRLSAEARRAARAQRAANTIPTVPREPSPPAALDASAKPARPRRATAVIVGGEPPSPPVTVPAPLPAVEASHQDVATPARPTPASDLRRVAGAFGRLLKSPRSDTTASSESEGAHA